MALVALVLAHATPVAGVTPHEPEACPGTRRGQTCVYDESSEWGVVERPLMPSAATCAAVDAWAGWCAVRAGLREGDVRREHARVCEDMRAVASAAVGRRMGRVVWREFEDWLCAWPVRFW